MSRGVIPLLLITSSVSLLSAQSAPATFEVISVKPSPPPGIEMVIRPGVLRGDRWVTENATLLMIIRSAYAPDFQLDGQIIGSPEWARSERFDIMATIEGERTWDRIRPMVRALLADRFNLMTRRERRELPVMAMTVRRSDGTLGPGIRAAGVDCDDFRAERTKGALPAAKPGGPPVCVTRSMAGPGWQRLESGGMTMAQLVSRVSGWLGQPILDRTGLSGDYAVDLNFAPEPGLSAAVSIGGDSPRLPISEGASLFDALQSQLGLKLERAREPVDVLVIERIGRPTPD